MQSDFNLDRIRIEKIKDFFILHETGYSLYHRAYVASKIDDDLISGFLSAIFTLSKELSIDRIHVMDMQESKFIYEARSPFIFILNVAKDVDPYFGKTILTQIINFFDVTFNNLSKNVNLDNHFLNKKLETINFNSKLDYFINKALLEHYFESPDKILAAIESYLISLFGTYGEEIINSSIMKVCKVKEKFKKENLEALISAVGEFLVRKVDANQAKLIKMFL